MNCPYCAQPARAIMLVDAHPQSPLPITMVDGMPKQPDGWICRCGNLSTPERGVQRAMVASMKRLGWETPGYRDRQPHRDNPAGERLTLGRMFDFYACQLLVLEGKCA